MIFDAIFAVLSTVIDLLLSLLPSETTFSLPIGEGFEFFQGAVAQARAYFPTETIATCLAALFGLKAVIFTWQVLTFIYDRLPLKSA